MASRDKRPGHRLQGKFLLWFREFCQGKTHEEIAETCGIALNSSRQYTGHVSNILGVPDEDLRRVVMEAMYIIAKAGRKPGEGVVRSVLSKDDPDFDLEYLIEDVIVFDRGA